MSCECGCGGEPRPGKRFIHGHNVHRPGNARNWTVAENGCWIWRGSTCQGGYGMVRVGGRAGESVLAHRHFYIEAKGPIPAGRELHHRCETPACVNPDHLEPLTLLEHAETRRDTKLSRTLAAEMRMLAAGGRTGASLAQQFGVSKSTACRAIKGTTWRDSCPAV